MRTRILFTLLLVFGLQSIGVIAAEGSPLLTDEDKSFLQRHLRVAPDDERICRLTKAEAGRLHRFIRAGDIGDVQAYLDNVTLDEVSDAAHHVPRADLCEPSK